MALPQILKVTDNKILIPNDTGQCVSLKKNDHFADITLLNEVDADTANIDKIYDLNRKDLSHLTLPNRPQIYMTKSYLQEVKIDPDNQLSEAWKQNFKNLCAEFSDVITPVPGRYNGYYGRVDNSLHFASRPAPIKARLPNYYHEKLVIQAKEMDKIEKVWCTCKTGRSWYCSSSCSPQYAGP